MTDIERMKSLFDDLGIVYRGGAAKWLDPRIASESLRIGHDAFIKARKEQMVERIFIYVTQSAFVFNTEGSFLGVSGNENEMFKPRNITTGEFKIPIEEDPK